ncbi:MAG: hypothetical protein AAF551_06405, partial [Bacteroidota bacterium]
AAGGVDEYDEENYLEGLEKILQYCQDNNITVMIGDWGYNQVDLTNNRMVLNRVKNAARYLNFLIEDRGFTCIKYYNTINEPNLIGSATNGNYELWRLMTRRFFQEFEALGNSNGVKIAGPDIAYFNPTDVDWVSQSARHLDDEIGLYDVHTYPPRESMFNGFYEETLKAMKDRTPAGSQIVIGEFGYKYDVGTSQMDEERNQRNQSNINADPNIGNDSNTLTEEYSHGVDLMGMVFKIINAGYAGAVNWGLDDAMHSDSETGQDLKVWGVWNILGEELLGKPEKELMRPHFYPYSLLTRYMQNGASVFEVQFEDMIGLDAIAVEKDGMRMLAFSNMHVEDHTINLKFEDGVDLSGIKKFVYKEEGRVVDANGYPAPEEEGLTLSASGTSVTIPSNTFILFTNFDY